MEIELINNSALDTMNNIRPILIDLELANRDWI